MKMDFFFSTNLLEQLFVAYRKDKSLVQKEWHLLFEKMLMEEPEGVQASLGWSDDDVDVVDEFLYGEPLFSRKSQVNIDASAQTQKSDKPQREAVVPPCVVQPCVQPCATTSHDACDHSSLSNANTANAAANAADADADADADANAIARDLLAYYRNYGYQLADLDPLGLKVSLRAIYAIDDKDLHKVAKTPYGPMSLKALDELARKIYAGKLAVSTVGIEQNIQADFWSWLENRHSTQLDEQTRRNIYKWTSEASLFEKFFDKYYPGLKRFSMSGIESAITGLQILLRQADKKGVSNIVIGQSHRGRLNIIAHILGKPYEKIFAECREKQAAIGSSDVKYHMGYSSKWNNVQIDMMYNPSHLESVTGVVPGYVRGLLDGKHAAKVLPIVLHGDAAFCGQGMVYEVLSISGTPTNRIGGTIHIVLDNQIGFTLDACDMKEAMYATGVAHAFQIPVIHINADDVLCIHDGFHKAFDYWSKTGRDILINIVGYRLHGHNEADQPLFTQPLMYKTIAQHKDVMELARDQLNIDQSYADKLQEEMTTKLLAAHEAAKHVPVGEISPLVVAATSVPEDFIWTTKELSEYMDKLTHVKEHMSLHAGVLRHIKNQSNRFQKKVGMIWGDAEALAFCTLLDRGYDVRLVGQDARRGTFSHRHAIWVDQQTQALYNIFDGFKGQMHIYSGPLSEEAAIAFEYGYSLVRRCEALTIWEAQFGDFVNGAQVILDQYISSCYDKWQQQSNVCLCLPHCYDGQGSEHSSARLERFLQMCAKDNMLIAYPTLPANHFHLLVQQAFANKPMVVMTPKSLLRDKICASQLSDFSQSVGLRPVVVHKKPAHGGACQRLVLCSGKIAYDMLKAIADQGEQQDEAAVAFKESVAIVSLDVLYPFPHEAVTAVLRKLVNNQTDVVWCQEEPRNMGAWNYMLDLAASLGRAGECLRYIGRPASASPAEGLAKMHSTMQKQILHSALNKST